MNLDEALEQVASAPTLLVATDFDGTLSEIVEDPGRAEPIEGAVDILGRLATLEGTRVAVVSGRAHADLIDRLGSLLGVQLIGEHGNDFGEEADDDQRMPPIKRFVDELNDELGPFRVEVKKKSIAVHTRALPNDKTQAVANAIQRWVLNNGWAGLLAGKEVFEISLASSTKADAVANLRDQDDAVVVFFGDDVTDESVFKSLNPRDVGVKVGSGPTSANQRVADPSEVVATMRKLLNLRQARSSQ